jgi:pimeloyl-ACP methyl ester carboxylesterase
MSTYVLVHGSWHGSWSWERVVPLLEQQGHTVHALDLPGYGADRPPWTNITLQHYVDHVCQGLDAQAEPVILVGHSRGGVVITQAAEERPEKIAALVYLCAFLPRNGESLIQLAQQDTETLIFPHLTFAEDLGYIAIKEEGLAAYQEVFCADCSEEDAGRAFARLVPDALAAAVTPVHTTDARFGRIPRTYIHTLRDRTVGPALQRQMYTAVPCQQIITMDTSHSPFFAAPQELAGHLASLAQVEAV